MRTFLPWQAWILVGVGAFPPGVSALYGAGNFCKQRHSHANTAQAVARATTQRRAEQPSSHEEVRRSVRAAEG
jgi:hypothetical protein